MTRLHISEYAAFKKELIYDGRDFETWATSYSRKVKVKRETFFFSDGETSVYIMKLIRMVRSDADQYQETNGRIYAN